MAKARKTFLFGRDRIATATRGRGKHEHTLGGPHDRTGTARADCNGILIHLLHRLDLTDPAVPIRIPGVRWLPLYYCFDFRANDLGYRLVSDEELVTFFPDDDPNVSPEESWPDDEGYPLEFPTCPITVGAFGYDPADLEDACRWAGVFGIGKLSARDQATAKERTAELMDGLGLHAPETDEEFERVMCSPFAQGRPDDPCLNPACPNREKRGQLTPIALLPAEPVPGVHTFGRYGGGVQLIFQLCPECATIRVSNQCD
ncbi:hypothetical protein [Gemmata obscuriglobus]|uniref:DUF1963 domain-containing protein n=1 Tax=Gemmata obscuriglobus TaxID=114 RepID=A0A2Z3HF28_9BACT|nr:hypothetical protein [Gemmata obscuriglobus]AWM40364.1 hypothetical protein C1280_27415 [Gemmata obscuriglobus]